MSPEVPYTHLPPVPLSHPHLGRHGDASTPCACVGKAFRALLGIEAMAMVHRDAQGKGCCQPPLEGARVSAVAYSCFALNGGAENPLEACAQVHVERALLALCCQLPFILSSGTFTRAAPTCGGSSTARGVGGGKGRLGTRAGACASSPMPPVSLGLSPATRKAAWL